MQAIRRIITAIFVVLAVTGYSQVPDTYSFDLDTVVRVVNPSSSDLQTSFDEAYNNGFDSFYVEDTNTLRNFRNYQHSQKIYSVAQLDNCNQGYIRHFGSDFIATQGDNAGTEVDTTSNYYLVGVYDNGTYWYIYRTFLSFDMTHIPSSASLVALRINFKIQNECIYGTGDSHKFSVHQSSQGCELSLLDYDDYSTELSSDIYRENGYISCYVQNSSYVEQSFGSNLKVAIIHERDISTTPPFRYEDDFELHRRGESLMLGEYPGTPTIEVIYKN
jgi:hypothetical protein